MNNKILIPTAIIVAGLLIALAIVFQPKLSTNPTPNGEVTIRPIDKGDHLVGNIDAPIVIVEYSDTECPYCKEFHKTMNDLVKKFPNDVAWVYRHFPIQQLHSKAMKEAMALECAADQGGNEKFWEYTNMIYETTPSNNKLPDSALAEIAQKIGLNVTEFNTCVEEERFKEKIEQDIEDARNAGATGTPFNVVISKDGTKGTIPGALPLSQMEQIINDLLANSKTN